MSFTCWMAVLAAVLAVAQGLMITMAGPPSAGAVWLVSATVVATLLLQGRCARRMRRGAFEARRTSAVQRDLLDGLAHDVRNPLLAITGYADVLARQWDNISPEAGRDFLRAIRRKVRDVELLVTCTIDEDGDALHDVPEAFAPFDLAASVHSAAADARILGSHVVVVHVPEALPAAIGDPRSHLRILSNLLSNAMKYSSRGSLVRVSLRERSDALEVSVDDEGSGILPEDLDNVLEPFERGRFLGDGDQPDGTGLGLYLCRVMVERNGGTIRLTSRPHEGTTVTYTVPKVPAARVELGIDEHPARVSVAHG